MIEAYHKRLTSSDRATQLAAARAWSIWEGTTLSLFHDQERIHKFGNESYALAFARIECHYFINKGFFRGDNQLIEDAGADRAGARNASSTAATMLLRQ